MPAVLGHEGAGQVIEIGDQVTAVAPGQHVVISWTPACGNCAECMRGQPFLCLTYVIEGFNTPRFTLGDGTPHSAWRLRHLGGGDGGAWQAVIPIADDVPFDVAALLGCGIPTASAR